jgi:large subunit ribosomal protein L10
MKTKAQKQEAVEKAGELIEKSNVLIYTDFGGVTVEDTKKLRRALREIGAQMFVLKKRLLGVAMKEKGHSFDPKAYSASVGAVFAPDGIESASGTVVKFFKERKLEKDKVLGGYDIAAKQPLEKDFVLMIGNLPSRDVLLGQFLGMLSAPVRSFLYILKQKSEQTPSA